MSSPIADGEDDRPRVEVTVVRTGGFAGIRREWRAKAGADDAPRWEALIKECPWHAAASGGPADRGADRFSWRITVRRGAEERVAQLSDTAIDGPWRALVDHVREAASSDAG